MDVLIIIACFYFAYNCISSVLKSPYAEWTWGHWGSLVVAAVLIVLGIMRTVLYFKTYKQRREKTEEKRQEEQRRLDEKRRSVYLYDDEGDEPAPEPEAPEEDDSFLDDLFEKQARALGVEPSDGEPEPETAPGADGGEAAAGSAGAQDGDDNAADGADEAADAASDKAKGGD